MDTVQQTECLVFNPMMLDIYAFIFYCATAGSGLRLYDGANKRFLRGLMSDIVSLFGPFVFRTVICFTSGCQCLWCLSRTLILVSSH